MNETSGERRAFNRFIERDNARLHEKADRHREEARAARSRGDTARAMMEEKHGREARERARRGEEYGRKYG